MFRRSTSLSLAVGKRQESKRRKVHHRFVLVLNLLRTLGSIGEASYIPVRPASSAYVNLPSSPLSSWHNPSMFAP
ncbi:hypothetical protein DL93DRAFT_2173544 [Clavulina sp. PMI_390]|nr:hypothetical protein DL93DRAFT_2173544 [Clavulina sp. PMI_390]